MKLVSSLSAVSVLVATTPSPSAFQHKDLSASTTGKSTYEGAASFQRVVEKWDDLNDLHGPSVKGSVYVQEETRKGEVVFVPNGSLPAWVTAHPPDGSPVGGGDWPEDLPGFFIGDSTDTGKWVLQWSGPADIGRTGAGWRDIGIDCPNSDPADERNAMTMLLNAGFDHIYFPEGAYDGDLRVPVVAPLRITGAGKGKTIFKGRDNNNDSAFLPRASLILEDLTFDVCDGLRIAEVELDVGDEYLGTVLLKLNRVDYSIDSAGPVSIIETRDGPIVDPNLAVPKGQGEPTVFRLEMDDCHFVAAPGQTHVNARIGLTGYIDNCTFEGGRHGIANIPKDGSAGPAIPSGTPGNVFSPGFRISDCEFPDSSGTPTLENYHIRATGIHWVISGCHFGSQAGDEQSGNIYSNLQDSTIIGCTFSGGGERQLFMKGSPRLDPSTVVENGNGWGNSIIGCSFEGGYAGSERCEQVTLNVAEQRFVGCRFRDFPRWAIHLTSQQTSADNLFIDDCSFESEDSGSAILFDSGGSARVLHSTFSGIVGAGINTPDGVIVFRGVSPRNTDFDDAVVEGCSFLGNRTPAVLFDYSTIPYTVRRLRFANNTVRSSLAGLPWGGGFEKDLGDISISGMVLEGNYFDVQSSEAWVDMPTGCVARSVDNTWVQGGEPAEATGVVFGSVLSDQLDLGPGDPVEIDAHTRLVRLAGTLPVTEVVLGGGAFDSQHLVVTGTSDAAEVLIRDAGNAALQLDRTLGAQDTLCVIWDASSSSWCELSYSDNN